ncbi:phosphodiester glycosidase family protein [Arenibacter sp. M-2]|uniref:phosphodiester glycosidase family protein n=1 Tax=Arenibacter sp. M-2 TaxID=3053612 RepID=UPI00256FEF05|nr:phosphodiester glycosidase family protein [Arenibacter sp. M-2]MDL5514938.1 phosphodiester glycosidase family protein [Arenibacter sp. M-2]
MFNIQYKIRHKPIVVVLALHLGAVLHAQIVKERDTLDRQTFADGSEYIHVNVPSMPLQYYVYKFKMSKKNKLNAVFANNRLPDLKRETIEMVSNRETTADNTVMAAINGDFFSYKNGEVEGFQVSNNQIVYAHIDKMKFGVNIDKKNYIRLDSVYFKGELKTKQSNYALTGVNTIKYNEAEQSIILYDSHIDFDSIQPKNHTLVLIKKHRRKFSYVNVLKSLPNDLGDKDYILALNMPNTESIIAELEQQRLFKINLRLVNKRTARALKLSSHISGGVPLVVKGRNVIKNKETISGSRGGIHPRTALGVNAKDNTVVWIVVDGRSDSSKGVNYKELSQLFLENNCTDALNLDGGGSSALWLLGEIKNTPSDKNGARPCLNYLLLSH